MIKCILLDGGLYLTRADMRQSRVFHDYLHHLVEAYI